MQVGDGTSRRKLADCFECGARKMVTVPAEIYSLEPEMDGRWLCKLCLAIHVGTALEPVHSGKSYKTPAATCTCRCGCLNEAIAPFCASCFNKVQLRSKNHGE